MYHLVTNNISINKSSCLSCRHRTLPNGLWPQLRIHRYSIWPGLAYSPNIRPMLRLHIQLPHSLSPLTHSHKLGTKTVRLNVLWGCWVGLTWGELHRRCQSIIQWVKMKPFQGPIGIYCCVFWCAQYSFSSALTSWGVTGCFIVAIKVQ